MEPLDPRDVRAFLARPWDELSAAKRRHWAERLAASGPGASLAASEALRAHMKAVRPGWPDRSYLEDDLAHHVALKRLLERAADALRPR